MYCPNCGNEIIKGDTFCTKCGTKVQNQVQTTTVQQTQTVTVVQDNSKNITADDNKKANLMCIISLILYFAVPIVLFVFDVVFSIAVKDINMIFTSLSGISRVVAIVLMIIARVKYPKNVFAKVLMWIYIGLIIFSLVLIVIITILVFSAVSSMW